MWPTLVFVVFAAFAAGFLAGRLYPVVRGLWKLWRRAGAYGIRLPQVPTMPAPDGQEGTPRADWEDPANAPPCMGGFRIPHRYLEAKGTPCCKECGGGSAHEVHAIPAGWIDPAEMSEALDRAAAEMERK